MTMSDVIQNLVNYSGLAPLPNRKSTKKCVMPGSSIQEEAMVIAAYIHKTQVLRKNHPAPDRIAETVSLLVEEFIKNNPKSLESITEMLVKGPSKEKTDDVILQNVFNSMFSDGKINWGRVGAVYAFGVRYCQKNTVDLNGNEYTDERSTEIMNFVGTYVGSHLGNWIQSQGGWETVLTIFPNDKVMMKQLKSAGYLILTVGLGSLFQALTS